MNHLRLLPSPASRLTSDDPCLEAFQRELNYVGRTFQRLGAPASEIDDLVHEVFLALRRSWADYKPDRPLRPRLFGTIFRIMSALHCTPKREEALGLLDLGGIEPWSDELPESRQARVTVLSALRQLSLPSRAVLVMSDLDDIPVGEIASVLAIPVFAAHSQLRTARQDFEVALRRVLTELDAE